MTCEAARIVVTFLRQVAAAEEEESAVKSETWRALPLGRAASLWRGVLSPTVWFNIEVQQRNSDTHCLVICCLHVLFFTFLEMLTFFIV